MKRKDMMTFNNNSPAKNFALSMLAVLPMLAATVSSSAIAAPTAVSEQSASTALNQYLTRLKSLEADFVQTTQLQNAKAAPAKTSSLNQGLRNSHLNQKFTGMMKVKRPGQFRWETTSPSKQLIVTSGQTVWIYDPDLEQAVRQKLDEQVANTPALLLSGQASNIMKSFRVTQPNAQEAYFVLYPKAEDGVFDSLGMRFSNNLPSQMVLKDSLGQQTTINFSNVKLNPNLNNSVFNFVPPKGTDVIDQ
jgi:outer membrane lipoprotein carrier protein